MKLAADDLLDLIVGGDSTDDSADFDDEDDADVKVVTVRRLFAVVRCLRAGDDVLAVAHVIATVPGVGVVCTGNGGYAVGEKPHGASKKRFVKIIGGTGDVSRRGQGSWRRRASGSAARWHRGRTCQPTR